MSADPSSNQMKGRLQDLQSALFDLRDELHRLSLAMQEYVVLSDDRLMDGVRNEASELFSRLQRRA